MGGGSGQFESAQGMSLISGQAGKALKSARNAAPVIEAGGEMQSFLIGGVRGLVVSLYTIDMTKVGQRASAAPAVAGFAKN
jgi:hypothetical protein